MAKSISPATLAIKWKFESIDKPFALQPKGCGFIRKPTPVAKGDNVGEHPGFLSDPLNISLYNVFWWLPSICLT